MLESSLHSKAVFVSFKTNEHTPYTLEKLLLEAEDQDIRNGVAIAMKSACVELPTFVPEILRTGDNASDHLK